MYEWFNRLLTCPSGPGKPERGKGTDIRIKLERPHDHQSSSVSETPPGLRLRFHLSLSATFKGALCNNL